MKQVTSFLSQEEIAEMGFKSCGKNVKISRFARFYSPDKISIGDNVRIDDFCILSGNITLGSHIHISAYVALYGAMGIVFEDYSGISAKSVIYSAMDDFSGDYLIGAIYPEEFTNVTGGLVRVCRFVQIGCNSVVFPDLDINEGSVIGACSLVNKSIDSWGIYAGIPCKLLKKRRNRLLSFFMNQSFIVNNE